MQRIRALILEAHRRSLWQVLGIYTFGAWAAYQIIAEVTDRLGLPAWVPGLAIVLFLIGLPIVLATAFVQEGLPGRAPAEPSGPADPTLVPDLDRGPLPEPRTTSALLSPSRPHAFLTWQRAVPAGVIAFLLLGVTASSYMGLRQAGVGPFASLLSAGTLEERDRILVAQLHHTAGDSITADALTEALRVDLAQSRVLNIVEQRFIGDALQRMDRPREARLTPQLAREVAIREGVKAVLEGEIAPAGSGYIITARLLHAATGELLLSRRETVAGDDDIIAAIDRMSKKLRSAIGESLRTVRADPPLEAVTTRSLTALRMYTQGSRALDLERDYDRATAVLREALAEDSTFAMAWRKLAVAYYNTRGAPDLLLEATTRAYELRDRLTERERYHTIAFYHLNVTGDDRAAVTAYRTLLEQHPNDQAALNNIALTYGRLRDDDHAAEYYRRALVADSFAANTWTNLVLTEYRRGQKAEARRMLADIDRRFPGQLDNRAFLAELEQAEGNYDAAEAITRRLVAESGGSEFWRARSNFMLANLLVGMGRVREAERHARESAAANLARGIVSAPLRQERWFAEADRLIHQRPEAAVRRLDALVASDRWLGLPPRNREHLLLGLAYARAGDADGARAMLAQWQALPAAERGDERQRVAALEGWIALAENRPADAIPIFRTVTATGECLICGLTALAQAFEAAGAADSAIAYYRKYIETPQMTRLVEDGLELAPTYERLAALYEQRGDVENARRYGGLFVQLWRNADPELQPRVRRMQTLLQRSVEQ